MKRIPHLRWYILALIFLATIINYLDRMTINVSAPVIAKTYKLDNETLAVVFSAFLWAYTLGPGPMGWVVDKIGSRRGYALSMGLWSGAGVLTAFALFIGKGLDAIVPLAIAPIVLGFIVCRFILGVGESANWPVAIKSISEWFAPKERSLAMGWFNSGSSVGVAVAPLLCAYLLAKWGWQAAFVAVGLIGFIWMALWLILYRPPSEHPWITERELDYIQAEQAKEYSPEVVKKAKWLDLLRIRQVLGVVVTRFFMDPIWWFYTFWLPTYFVQDRHLDLKKMAIFTALSFVSSDLGNLFGGWMTSRLVKRGRSINAARKMVMTPCAVLMMLGIAIPFVPEMSSVTWSLGWFGLTFRPDLTVVVSLIAIVMFCYQSWSVNMMSIPADVVPKSILGSAAGLSHMGAGFGGIVVTMVAGYLSTKYHSFKSVIMLMGLMPIVGITFLYLVIGRIAPYRKDAADEVAA